MRKHAFFLHYNKPASQQAKKVLWSIHFRGVCYVVENIKIDVSCQTKSNKRQPYAVVKGMANFVAVLENGIARVWNLQND
jgi:hypothetical protein